MKKLVMMFALGASLAFPVLAEEVASQAAQPAVAAQSAEQHEVVGRPAGPQAARLGRRKLSPAGYAMAAAAFGATAGAVSQAGDTTTTGTTGTIGTTQ